MKALRIFLIVLACFGTSFLQANLSPTPKPAAIPPPKPVVPDPMRLNPSWWEYFKVDEPEFTAHLQTTLEALNKLQDKLTNEDNKDAITLIERIKEQFKSLPEIKGLPPAMLPIKSAYSGFYTLDRFVNLGLEKIELEDTIISLKNKSHLREKNIKSGSSYLDSLLAQYLNTSEKSTERLLMGLEIILTKVELVLSQHRLSVDKRTLENEKNKLTSINKEIIFARHHLEVTDKSLAEIEKAKQVAIDEKGKCETDSFRALARFNEKVDPSEHSQIERDIATQAVHRSNVCLATSSIRLITQNILLEFAKILKDKDNAKISHAYEQIDDWKHEITKIQKDIAEWKNNTNQEMERTLKSLSSPDAEANEAQLEQRALILVNETLLSIRKLENSVYLSAFLIEELNLLLKETFSGFFQRLYSTWLTVVSVLKSHALWFDQSLFKIGATPITPMGIIKMILIIVVAYFLAKFVQRMIKRIGDKYSHLDDSATYTLSRAAYYVIFYIGIFIAITSFGIEFTAIAFIAGAVTFWMGFGLIPIVTSFVSGIIVLMDKNIRRGDYIELESGEKGTIVEMNVRTSILYSNKGQRLIIPNSELVLKKFFNRSHRTGPKKLIVSFEVSGQADKAAVKECLLEGVKQMPQTSPHHQPQLYLKKFNKNRYVFELLVWINQAKAERQPEALYASFMWSIDSILRDHNIDLAEDE